MRYLYLTCLFLITSFMWGQEPFLNIDLKKSHEALPGFDQIAMTVEKGSLKEAFKALSKELSKTTKDRISGNEKMGLITANNTNWKMLPYPGLVHIRTRIQMGSQGLTILMAFSDSAFRPLDLQSGQLDYHVSKYLKKLGTELYISALNDMVKTERKVLGSFDKEMKGEQKKIKRSEKNILGHQNKIEALKEDIEVGKTEQARLIEEVKAIDRKIAGINPADTEQTKAVKKEKSGYEARLKKSRKSVDKSRKQVFDLEKRIEDEQRKIKDYEVDENSAALMLKKQQEAIDQLMLKIQEAQGFLRAK
jgi:hypothetical protein